LRSTRVDLARTRGNPHEALEHAAEAVRLCRAYGDTPLAFTLGQSVIAQAMVGDSAGALPEAEEAIALAHGMGNPRYAQGVLAMAAFGLGDAQPERALALIREAAELSPDERTPIWGIAGDLAARQGRQRDALEFNAKAIDAMQWRAMRPELGSVLARTPDLLAHDDPSAAAVLYGAADTLASGFALPLRLVTERQQAHEALDTSLGQARRAELHAQGRTMSDDDAIAYAHTAINR